MKSSGITIERPDIGNEYRDNWDVGSIYRISSSICARAYSASLEINKCDYKDYNMKL